MAKYKPGIAGADVRGSIGGSTFTKNRYGQIIRNKTSPVQPRTPAQMAQRAQMTAISQAWRDTLTAAQRTAWEAYANQTPLADCFGDRHAMTGLAMFARFNTVFCRLGFARLDTAPATPGEAEMPTMSLTGTTGAGVNITAVTPTLNAGDIIHILVCNAPVSQARNFFNGPFTHLGHAHSASVYPMCILTPAQVALGQRWFFQTRLYLAQGKVGPTNRQYIDILV